MQVIINKEKLELNFCLQLAFRGNDESLIENLQADLKKDNYNVAPEIVKGEISILVNEFLDVNKTLEYVKKYKGLKAVGIFDYLDSAKQRHSYMLFSEVNKGQFTKYTYIGWCDGQEDNAFSEQVNMLIPKTQSFSGTHSLTGKKWKISYAFPYESEWNGDCDPSFVIDGKTLIKYKGDAPIVEIPNEVAEIGKGAFKGCLTIQKLMLSKNVRIIQQDAFRKCINLKEIDFKEGLQFIGDYAFADCTGLHEIVLPDSLSKDSLKVSQDTLVFNKSSHYVFSKCTGLENVKFGSKLKKVPNSWFKGCSNLQNVNLPISIIQIEESAFENCKSLKNIEFPNTLKKIGGSGSFGSSFAGCISLGDVIIPPSVEKIVLGTFKKCEKINLKVQKDSEGEKFAKKEGLPYQYI